MTTVVWSRVLVCTSLLVAVYAVGLVLIGPLASRLFDLLGFGMRGAGVPAGAPADHVLLVYGVLGSVLVGWMILVAGIALGPLRAGEAWAWPALAASVGVWFVLDTGFSLAVGSWQHALFNIGFVAVLGGPLVGWRVARRRSHISGPVSSRPERD